MFFNIVNKVFHFVPSATIWVTAATTTAFLNRETTKTVISGGEKRAEDTWFRKNVTYPTCEEKITATIFEHIVREMDNL